MATHTTVIGIDNEAAVLPCPKSRGLSSRTKSSETYLSRCERYLVKKTGHQERMDDCSGGKGPANLSAITFFLGSCYMLLDFTC